VHYKSICNSLVWNASYVLMNNSNHSYNTL